MDKNVEFIFAGSWVDQSEVAFKEFFAKNKKLPIFIKGPVYGLAKYKLLASSDVFVFTPASPEGHPWVIVEALASGLPIIATDQGAIKESVKDGANGFIVESNNPIQIAEKIRYLIENPEKRIQMGEASKRIYSEDYTEEKMIDRLSLALKTILNDSD